MKSTPGVRAAALGLILAALVAPGTFAQSSLQATVDAAAQEFPGRAGIWQRRLNHFVGVPVAHKTGDFPPVLANDVGVIYTRSGPVVVAFLGNAITGNYGEAEDHIGRFAQRLMEYFDK